MNITAAARMAGMAPDTLRYYERSGVLPAPSRKANGYRDYTADHVMIVQLARALRELDLSLAEVRDIVRVAHDGTCGELRSTLLTAVESCAADVERRIDEMRRTKRQLRHLREGLRRMQLNDASVPGLAPCQCIAAVHSDRPTAG
jgi:DNA-binding transcriptional MerR regulator